MFVRYWAAGSYNTPLDAVSQSANIYHTTSGRGV